MVSDLSCVSAGSCAAQHSENLFKPLGTSENLGEGKGGCAKLGRLLALQSLIVWVLVLLNETTGHLESGLCYAPNREGLWG